MATRDDAARSKNDAGFGGGVELARQAASAVTLSRAYDEEEDKQGSCWDEDSDGVTAKNVREACVAPKTQVLYRSSLRSISKWIVKTKKTRAAAYFDPQGQLNLMQFSPKDFEAFLLSRRKTLRVSTLNGYRSAIKDLYRRKEMPLPAAYGKRLATFFSGLRRMEADERQAGSPRESGKDPLPYSLYEELCWSTLKRHDAGFSHLFLTTQWNMMCRSESAATICTEHLCALDDSVGCVIHKSKTNQEGTGPKDPKHLFANPMNPSTCWITALGVFLASHPMQEPGPLFRGSKQKARFGKILGDSIHALMQTNHFGTHSIRKGVATYACGGTTCGPTIASVCLRVGWSLGGVQDRYIRYEAAGDQFLGRIVAGLPIDRAGFAILPPHFADNSDTKLQEAIDLMFPSLKDVISLKDVLKLCLASLSYHAVFLKASLPSTHPLLSTYLFREENALDSVRSKLVAGPSPWMKATGIPPHVELFRQNMKLQRSVDSLPGIMLAGMGKLLDEKGAVAGNITQQMLEESIGKMLHQAGFQHTAPTPPVPETATAQPTYCYDGKLHRLPKSFQFPKTDVFGAWMLWWFGHRSAGYPPLRSIHTHDLPSRSMSKTYSEWSTMMGHIEWGVRQAGIEIPRTMTEDRAASLLRVGMDQLTLAPSKRKRRLGELAVTTVLRLVREANPDKRTMPFVPRKKRIASSSYSEEASARVDTQLR